MLRSVFDRPLVCLALAFILGLVLASYGLALAPAVASVAAALAFAFTRRRVMVGVLVVCLAALASGQLYLLDQRPAPHSVGSLREGGQTLVGTVASAPHYVLGRWMFLFAVESHEEGSVSQPIGGNCEVCFNGHKPARGERWRFTGRLRLPGPPRNPGGGPTGERYAAMGASGSLSAEEELAQRLGPGREGWLDQGLSATQQEVAEALESHVGSTGGEVTASVANSVIFGVHASPPPDEIADAFRRAGTMHLLVVSGSMVSLVFGMVFFPGLVGHRARHWWARRGHEDAPSSGRGRIRSRPGLLAAGIAALIIIYYALLTEGGQAVWRALISGLLISLAFALRRIPALARQHPLTPDRYTLLAAAALIILAFQPSALFAARLSTDLCRGIRLAVLHAPAPADVQAACLSVCRTRARYFRGAGRAISCDDVALRENPLRGSGFQPGGRAAGRPHRCYRPPDLPASRPPPPLAGLPGWITGWCTRGLIRTSSFFAGFAWSAPEVNKPAPWMIVLWYAASAGPGGRARPSFHRPLPPNLAHALRCARIRPQWVGLQGFSPDNGAVNPRREVTNMTTQQLSLDEGWRRETCEVCLQIGLPMLGVGLLYWGLVIAHAVSLGPSWAAEIAQQSDPLGSLGEPVMWAAWVVYWVVTMALLRTGMERTGKHAGL